MNISLDDFKNSLREDSTYLALEQFFSWKL